VWLGIGSGKMALSPPAPPAGNASRWATHPNTFRKSIGYCLMPIKHDPQEDNSIIKAKIDEARREALENLADIPKGRGFCHREWAEQKRILKEKYQIDWKSPSGMNPEIFFD
jgi:hypothetical protein